MAIGRGGEEAAEDEAEEKRRKYAALHAHLRDPNWRAEDKFQLSSRATKEELFCTDVSIGYTGKRKIVHYDAHRLLVWGGFLTMFVRGTVFSISFLFYRSMLQYVATFAVTIAVMLVAGLDGGSLFDENSFIEGTLQYNASLEFDKKLIRSIEEIHETMQRPTMFIFGLFTSLTISRWWALRIGSVGYVMDAVVHIAALLAGECARKKRTKEEREGIEQDIMKIIKLGVASLQCVTQQWRGHLDYDSLVQHELLAEAEIDLIRNSISPGQVLWSWICVLGGNILERLKVPAPNHNPFFNEVILASNAITRMEAYHNSQLPFPYIHMMVMLVNMNNIAVAILDGLLFTLAYRQSQELVCVMRVLHLVLVPTMYQGLLQICFLVEDPMGDDITDFSIINFQSRVYDQSKRVLLASGQWWELRRSRQEASEPAAEPPVAAPATERGTPEALEQQAAEAALRRFKEEAQRLVAGMKQGIAEVSMCCDGVQQNQAGEARGESPAYI